jgi:cell division protein FtsI/penicillin-binding protein 2
MSLNNLDYAFKTYRDMLASFGLGVKTGIDLPVESLGYSGTSKLPGHLLDFSIGQYDTYTPIQLSQYINTIANGGKRLKPFLLKEVKRVP